MFYETPNPVMRLQIQLSFAQHRFDERKEFKYKYPETQ